ncbi:Glutaredoxin-related protein [Actinobacillus indolicus]|nr:Glutaredoxin-related protein [Actinobacillus indolicus]VTU07005.1 Glutaredoxin-related protein [Actinobacillus indolicus]
MTKPVLYFAHWCPDTAPFVAELQRLGIDYEEREMTTGGANLKAFLKLRDNHPAFDNAKANGYIGIPALVLEDERVVLDLAGLAQALTY